MIHQFEEKYLIAELIVKHLQQEITEEESIVLQAWLDASASNRDLYEELITESSFNEELAIVDRFNASDDWEKLKNAALHTLPQKQIATRFNVQFWISIAAILIAVCCSLLFFFPQKNKNSKNTIALNNKILPGSDKATLKLADGTVIILNDSLEGFQANQRNVKLHIRDGEIFYQAIDNTEEIIFNTVSTPRGGQFKLVLSDGTRVWLNAASSIKYPTVFVGADRVVELTGEAYFEVSHNPSKPFKVVLPAIGQVDAIGTAFNINAYPEEKVVKTSLIQGKVKVAMGGKTNYLHPGQQSLLNKEGHHVIVNEVDMDEIVAWKNGLFIFNQSNVEDIMRQLARWYAIEVIYSGKISQETFSGIVNRNSNLSEVLKIMEAGGVRFKIENKTIYVF